MSGSWTLLPSLGITALVFLVALFLITVNSIATDARRRGKPAFLVVLLCLVSFPLGLLLWLVFRPEIQQDDDQNATFQLNDWRRQ